MVFLSSAGTFLKVRTVGPHLDHCLAAQGKFHRKNNLSYTHQFGKVLHSPRKLEAGFSFQIPGWFLGMCSM